MRKLIAGVTLGLLLSAAQSAVAANLVTNGGFETGNFSGWTQFGNTSFTAVDGPIFGVDPHSGNRQAYFGPSGSAGGIQQTLTVTPNTDYTIEFWLNNLAGAPNFYQLLFDGVPLTVVGGSGAFEYTHFSFTGTTDGDATAVLRFAFQHDPSLFFLDDVSVDLAAVPEPATLALLGLGLAGLGAAGRRRKG